MRDRLRILMPSIVDADIRRGGAWTVTRGLVELLRQDPWNAEVVSLVPPEPRWRRVRQAACLASAPWSGLPAKVSFLHSRDFRNEVRGRLNRERFDLLLVNGSDLLWCLDEAPPRIRTLAVVHNNEADLYADQVTATTPRIRLLRSALLLESKRLREFELGALRRAQAALFLSAADAAYFARRIPGLEHLVLPPLFSEPPQRMVKDPSGWIDLGLMANFEWWPNREAVGWFIQEVLDDLPGDLRIHLFGHRSTDMAAAHPRIIAHGFVDDLRDVWRRCDWMLVPTRYGAGVSVKTAESLYHGMPILSTRFGLRGIPTISHPQIVIRDSAEEWVSFLSSALARTLCRERLPLDVSGHFALGSNRDRFERFLARVLDPEMAAV